MTAEKIGRPEKVTNRTEYDRPVIGSCSQKLNKKYGKTLIFFCNTSLSIISTDHLPRYFYLVIFFFCFCHAYEFF